jgi:hypothetical protein
MCRRFGLKGSANVASFRFSMKNKTEISRKRSKLPKKFRQMTEIKKRVSASLYSFQKTSHNQNLRRIAKQDLSARIWSTGDLAAVDELLSVGCSDRCSSWIKTCVSTLSNLTILANVSTIDIAGFMHPNRSPIEQMNLISELDGPTCAGDPDSCRIEHVSLNTCKTLL